MRRLFVALVIGLVLGGCHSYTVLPSGKLTILQQDIVDRIKPGITTEGQVMFLFGEPASIVIEEPRPGDRVLLYVSSLSLIDRLYLFSKNNSVREKQEHWDYAVAITLGPDHIVRAVRHNVPYSKGWVRESGIEVQNHALGRTALSGGDVKPR